MALWHYRVWRRCLGLDITTAFVSKHSRPLSTLFCQSAGWPVPPFPQPPRLVCLSFKFPDQPTTGPARLAAHPLAYKIRHRHSSLRK
ncbi:hypothetical protein LMH87_000405 [Akanthomyces muscarius]|uniref:Uncharacterized protein n=1 Tax=Akanthomyces muscarius TaxID=2231603 RepID=A0A9W8QGR6_AKAMU|nr:hypothetical protein LMH87_000405 [Akanthomyces muscarius]KAJ4155147.1 hypothetical protein LMH87_000405 [Akanthomyces muscarius]